LLGAAIALGFTQKQIENEFYMLDVFEAVRKKREAEAHEQLSQLNIVNSHRMEPADYKRYINQLMRQANIVKKEQTFSREKMDALHAFTNGMNGGG
jgi:uncharacterized protein YfkK (UPF0435 family)